MGAVGPSRGRRLAVRTSCPSPIGIARVCGDDPCRRITACVRRYGAGERRATTCEDGIRTALPLAVDANRVVDDGELFETTAHARVARQVAADVRRRNRAARTGRLRRCCAGSPCTAFGAAFHLHAARRRGGDRTSAVSMVVFTHGLPAATKRHEHGKGHRASPRVARLAHDDCSTFGAAFKAVPRSHGWAARRCFGPAPEPSES